MDRVMQPERSDTEIEAAVNHGLVAAFLTDFEAGVAIMREAGVPAHVVKRVLDNFERRRATDWRDKLQCANPFDTAIAVDSSCSRSKLSA